MAPKLAIETKWKRVGFVELNQCRKQRRRPVARAVPLNKVKWVPQSHEVFPDRCVSDLKGSLVW